MSKSIRVSMASLFIGLMALVSWRLEGPGHPPLVSAQSTITVVTVADITGDGSAHPLASSGTARWIQIDCQTGNSAAIRLGDSDVGAARGTSCAAGGGMFYPPITVGSNLYSLSTIYYRAANGDVLHVQYAQ